MRGWALGKILFWLAVLAALFLGALGSLGIETLVGFLVVIIGVSLLVVAIRAALGGGRRKR